MMDLYRIKVASFPSGFDHDHREVVVEPATSMSEAIERFTLAEWHRAMTDIAGVFARAALALMPTFNEMVCDDCQRTTRPLCGPGSGPGRWNDLTDPAGLRVFGPEAIRTAPLVDWEVGVKDEKRALKAVRQTFAQLTEADEQTFSAGQEQEWKAAEW